MSAISNTHEVKYRSDMTVELVKCSASDYDVLFAARVSTGGDRVEQYALDHMEGMSSRDEGLIRFLMKNRHGTPFEHSTMTFYIQAPIFVAREFMRHRMFSLNEESGRYRELEPVFYVPAEDRPLVQVGKAGAYQFEQGTSDQYCEVTGFMRPMYRQAYTAYKEMLRRGIAREVARMVLPVGIYTSWYATVNARALMNFLGLRVRSDVATFASFPQREIEMVAEQMEAQWATRMPVTHGAFVANGRVAP